MALKIKKQIKNPDGTITEIEGTEAEVEAFLRKAQKQNETAEKAERKKNLILGKDAIDQIEALIKHYISIHELVKPHSDVRYTPYWYRVRDWWYQPVYGPYGVITYTMTNTDPSSGNVGVVYNVNSVTDAAEKMGCSVADVNLNGALCNSTNGVLSTSTSFADVYKAAIMTTDDVDNLTSGIVNMNIKS